MGGRAAKHESILLSMPPAAPAPVRPKGRRTEVLVGTIVGLLVAGAVGYALLGPRLWPVADDRDAVRPPPAETYGAPLGDPGTAERPAAARTEPSPTGAVPEPSGTLERSIPAPPATVQVPPEAAAAPATDQVAPTSAPPATTPAAETSPPREAGPARTPPSPPTTVPTSPPRVPAVDHTAVAAAVSNVVAGFDCADLSATLSSDMTVFVSGRVASAKDQRALESRLAALEHVKGVVPRVEVLESPFCDVMNLLGPLGLAPGQDGRKGPAIGVNSPTRTFREGQFLVVEVTAGAGHRGHLYVDYLDSAGNFVHMLPGPSNGGNAVAPGQRIVLGGDQAEYLPALDAQLARLQADGRLDEVTANALFIQTQP